MGYLMQIIQDARGTVAGRPAAPPGSLAPFPMADRTAEPGASADVDMAVPPRVPEAPHGIDSHQPRERPMPSPSVVRPSATAWRMPPTGIVRPAAGPEAGSVDPPDIRTAARGPDAPGPRPQRRDELPSPNGGADRNRSTASPIQALTDVAAADPSAGQNGTSHQRRPAADDHQPAAAGESLRPTVPRRDAARVITVSAPPASAIDAPPDEDRMVQPDTPSTGDPRRPVFAAQHPREVTRALPADPWTGGEEHAPAVDAAGDPEGGVPPVANDRPSAPEPPFGVHIGRIDIVVSAPANPRPAEPPRSAATGVSSRLYLRGL